ncbi:MAG: hypothetical protein WKF61_07240 [Luteimonas sp.]
MRLIRCLATLALWLACATAAAVDADAGLAATVERIRSGAGAHRVILLGETHGTRETLVLIASLVAAYAIASWVGPASRQLQCMAGTMGRRRIGTLSVV